MSLNFSVPSIERLAFQQIGLAARATPALYNFVLAFFKVLMALTPPIRRAEVNRMIEQIHQDGRANAVCYRVAAVPDMLPVQDALKAAHAAYSADAINAQGGNASRRCPYRALNLALRTLGYPVRVEWRGYVQVFDVPEAPGPAGRGDRWQGMILGRDLSWSEPELALCARVCFIKELTDERPRMQAADMLNVPKLPHAEELGNFGRVRLTLETPDRYFNCLGEYTAANRMLLLLGSGRHGQGDFRMAIRNVVVHFVPIPQMPQVI